MKLLQKRHQTIGQVQKPHPEGLNSIGQNRKDTGDASLAHKLCHFLFHFFVCLYGHESVHFSASRFPRVGKETKPAETSFAAPKIRRLSTISVPRENSALRVRRRACSEHRKRKRDTISLRTRVSQGGQGRS